MMCAENDLTDRQRDFVHSPDYWSPELLTVGQAVDIGLELAQKLSPAEIIDCIWHPDYREILRADIERQVGWEFMDVVMEHVDSWMEQQ